MATAGVRRGVKAFAFRPTETPTSLPSVMLEASQGASADLKAKCLNPVERETIMATQQRLSSGCHRLGIVLAAIPLVLGIAWTALTPVMYPGMIPHALTGIAGTFAATLAVYGIVRAIGWVIGGFVAS